MQIELLSDEDQFYSTKAYVSLVLRPLDQMQITMFREYILTNSRNVTRRKTDVRYHCYKR